MELIADDLGADKVNIPLGYVGTIPSSYPINAVFHWSHGSEEATMWVGPKRGHGLDSRDVQRRLREKVAAKFPKVRFSFEPADLINQGIRPILHRLACYSLPAGGIRLPARYAGRRHRPLPNVVRLGKTVAMSVCAPAPGWLELDESARLSSSAAAGK